MRIELSVNILLSGSLSPSVSSLDMSSLERRRLRGTLIECFKTLDGFTNIKKSKLFTIDHTLQTRKNGTKLTCRQVNSECTKIFLTNVVKVKLGAYAEAARGLGAHLHVIGP